jgi:hypothetical protein
MSALKEFFVSCGGSGWEMVLMLADRAISRYLEVGKL